MAALQAKQPQHGRGSAGGHPIDRRVGSRIRLRRVMLGLSQGELGAAIDLTFQQIQKYERGTNRIAASRLHRLSEVLDVPVAFFFDDLDPVRAPPIPSAAETEGAARQCDPFSRPETGELIAAYYAIADARVRRHILALAGLLAAEGTRATGSPDRSRQRHGSTN